MGVRGLARVGVAALACLRELGHELLGALLVLLDHRLVRVPRWRADQLVDELELRLHGRVDRLGRGVEHLSHASDDLGVRAHRAFLADIEAERPQVVERVAPVVARLVLGDLGVPALLLLGARLVLHALGEAPQQRDAGRGGERPAPGLLDALLRAVHAARGRAADAARHAADQRADRPPDQEADRRAADRAGQAAPEAAL